MEEFLALFPEHNDSDAHELMVARINHEHAEREKLEQARQELLKRKQALIAENNKRKDDLASLDQDLERFIDVSPRPRLFPFSRANQLTDNARLPNRSRSYSKRSIDLLYFGKMGGVWGCHFVFFILYCRPGYPICLVYFLHEMGISYFLWFI